MAEWSNALVLKTSDLNGSVGSNPTLSASIVLELSLMYIEINMFIAHPNNYSYQYYIIDEKHRIGKIILNTSRRAASKHIRNQDNKKDIQKLEQIFKELELDKINILSVMLMISNKWNGATGQGGIWATASEIVNNIAKQELKNRPIFEITTEGT